MTLKTTSSDRQIAFSMITLRLAWKHGWKNYNELNWSTINQWATMWTDHAQFGNYCRRSTVLQLLKIIATGKKSDRERSQIIKRPGPTRSFRNSVAASLRLRSNKINYSVRIPTGGRLTSWLFTQRGREVELGTTKNKSSNRVEDLYQGPPDFKSSALNHLATLPPLEPILAV